MLGSFRLVWRPLLAAAIFVASVNATPVPIGVLSFDQAMSNSTTGVFNILNLTGISALPPDFPVVIAVQFIDPSLTVEFVGGGTTTLTGFQFVSDGNGGFLGQSLFDIAGTPIASAILSGMISPTTLMLSDGTTVQDEIFTAMLQPSAGSSLQFSDTAVINADAAPEPGTWTLLGAGALLLVLVRFQKRAQLFLFFVLLAAAQSAVWAQVNLTAAAQPPTGNAGITIENVTGSGFPPGAIAPASVTISLAGTCNATPAASTPATAITTIVGSTRRVSFTTPSVAAGTYSVSVNGPGFTTASCSSLTVTAPDQFVHAVNGKLMLNGFPFRFGGGNIFSLMYSPRASVDQVLQAAVSNHLRVIRTWSFIEIGNCDGTNTIHGAPNGIFFHCFDGTNPSFNDGANGLVNLDYAVFKAGQLGLKLIIGFTNNWTDFGGMDQYVKWRGGSHHDDFYTDPVIRQWYKDWVGHLLTRVNTFTQIAYKDDPTIMIWELANEPRCAGSGPSGGGFPTSGMCTPQTIEAWIQDSAAFVKAIDNRHLLSVGDEGFFCNPSSPNFIDNCSTGVDTLTFAETPGIDVMGFHLYPEGWGQTLTWADGFVEQHFQDAAGVVNKPAYLGEFAVGAGNVRTSIYKEWTDRALNDTGATGGLFWDLTPGQTSAAAQESSNNFDLKDGSPSLLAMGNFAQMMTANAVLPLPPVAGDQWVTTPFGQSTTLNPFQNDVAYAGAMIDPATIDLDPATPGKQTMAAVVGGTFNATAQGVQFIPTDGFNGTAQASYTVEDSNHRLSNIGNLFVLVKPSATGSQLIESFETGTDGWGPLDPTTGTVAQSSSFHTDGNSSLLVNATASGWFGVNLPSTLNLFGRPALSIDIQTTNAGGNAAISFQSGSGFTWCQSDFSAVLPSIGLTTLTIPLDPSKLTCFSPNTPDLTQIHAIWVFLNGPGTYYLDNVVAAPPLNPSAPILIESFESGDAGWHSINGLAGTTVKQTTAFHSDGAFGLSITTNMGVSDWFGTNLSSPIDLTGKAMLAVDIQTQNTGTSTNIAIQTGNAFTFCQGANFGFQNTQTTGTVTIPLDATKLQCFPSGSTPDFTSLRAVWVWISGGDTFYVDNVRAQ
jgi:mannan endo-1,4-beta-mannosidase